MPQLHPAPWFPILILSWLIFLTIIPSLVMPHTFPNEPSTINTKKPEAQTWTWPWQ